MDYNFYDISNDGYSPTGTPVINDEEGNSIYYTPYIIDDSSSLIKTFISNHQVLSDNPNVRADSSVEYKVNDMIVDKVGDVVIITSISPVDMNIIGSMIVSEDYTSSSVSYDASKYFNMIVFDDYTSYPDCSKTDNVYNRNDSSTVHSPFYHHRDIDTSVYGTKIYSATDQILEPYYDSSVIFDNNGRITKEVRLVINFNDGMRYTVPVDSDILDSSIDSNNTQKQSYFIDNRYFYPYGFANDSSYWSKSIFSSSDETGDTAINDCMNFYDGRKILSAYVEFVRKYDTHNTIYRVPVKFGNISSDYVYYELSDGSYYETIDNMIYTVKNS